MKHVHQEAVILVLCGFGHDFGDFFVGSLEMTIMTFSSVQNFKNFPSQESRAALIGTVLQFFLLQTLSCFIINFIAWFSIFIVIVVFSFSICIVLICNKGGFIFVCSKHQKISSHIKSQILSPTGSLC